MVFRPLAIQFFIRRSECERMRLELHPAERLWRATLRHQGRLADDGFSQIFLLKHGVHSCDNRIQLPAQGIVRQEAGAHFL